MSELRDVIAKPIEETMIGWFSRNWTIVDGNLSRACSDAVIAAIGDSGRVVVDRARFERIMNYAITTYTLNQAIIAEQEARSGDVTHIHAIAEDAIAAYKAIQPGDLDPL